MKDIGELIAEWEKDPLRADELAKARKWVRKKIRKIKRKYPVLNGDGYGNHRL